MNLQQQQSVLTIAMLAAFADGAKDDTEREEIRRIAQSLAAEGNMPDLPRLYQDVLLRRTSLESAAAALQDPTHRQLAYEMAVCVCDVDGRQTPTEREFLAHLKQTLQLGGAATAAFDQEEQALLNALDGATTPTATKPGLPVPVPVPVPAAAPSGPSAAAVQRDAELDKSILNYALLNGALELLPQSWASMAIIPLQIKMVHAIGLAHGVELDRGHIKEFIAAAGVGMASQYVEQFGRKLLGGLLGKVAGKTLGNIGQAATGMAFSFATTYALGQVAKRYYAGGRVMSTAMLRESFQDMLGPAKQLQTEYLPQIRQKAATLDAGQIMSMVRGA